MEIQPTDLLFVKNQHNGMDDAISESTGMGEYVHVAIVIDYDYVIDATPDKGVSISSLADFISSNQFVDVYRPLISEVEKISVVDKAKLFEHEPYNASFYPDGEGKYCSQLVEVAFTGVLNFGSVKMQFGDEVNVVSDYWATYYDKLGIDVPLNELGSNPNQMAKSSDLIYLGVL